ncbi:MAG: M12 family metallopeptidase [Nitrososphaeraceae archaeon]
MPDANSEKDSSLSDNKNTDSASSDIETGWHTGYIHGNTFKNKEVKFRKINGMAIFEGDIILARTPEEMERLSPKKPSFDKKLFVKAVARTGEQFRWPRGEIPYEIRGSLPNQKRITDAIYHWEERTHIRFIPRTNYNARHYPNYVSFIQYTPQPGEKQDVFHCSSPIGMQGSGEQSIVVSDQCITGDVIHEIGHTVGLWHEQSRDDRDNFIRVVFDNIEPKDVHNFSQHISDGDDVGDYDYGSIMHYGASYFSKNGLPTIEVLKIESPDAGSIGQKNGLSVGDIAAANQLYANKAPTVIYNIGGNKLEVFTRSSDGQIYRSSQKTSSDSKSYTGWSPDRSVLWIKNKHN